MIEELQETTILAKTAVEIDPDYDASLFQRIAADRTYRVSPYSVVLGINESGQERALNARRDQAFLNSIKTFSVMDPVTVKFVKTDTESYYRVTSGNRRTAGVRHLIASSEIGESMPQALIPIQLEGAAVNDLGIDNSAIINLLENYMRQLPNAIERARAMQELKDMGKTTKEIGLLIMGKDGRPLSKDVVEVSLLFLKMHPKVIKAVEKGMLGSGNAELLVYKSHEEQIAILDDLVASCGDKPIEREDVKSAIKKRKASKAEDGSMIYGSVKGWTAISKMLDEVINSASGDDEQTEKMTYLAKSFKVWVAGGLVPKSHPTWEDKSGAIKARFFEAFNLKYVPPKDGK